jgi:hypothetical protein
MFVKFAACVFPERYGKGNTLCSPHGRCHRLDGRNISRRSKEPAAQGVRTNRLVYRTKGRQGCGGYPPESPEYGRGDLFHEVGWVQFCPISSFLRHDELDNQREKARYVQQALRSPSIECKGSNNPNQWARDDDNNTSQGILNDFRRRC